ncbi:Clp amino terminal domain-containing protein, pathogenicity island component [Amycolatopsis marina]|uniref:Clp amino terminal domain-containing protein, pathogenicity island component n=1 Tax=Amycolatopsis marina TaxID=490629 RepID=A0A1I0XH21_9PSEU|nr:Clp protease N-terminal domain-containing protein [Amycolatopsis marina]SFB00302.1 Clp amino terminal domain-containing protein, pathogenicity island component [Amycolatopsis marina]
MFERFTRDARVAVIDAQEHAVRLRTERIEPEHLLLALLDSSGGVLGELGVEPASLADELAKMRRRGGISASDVAALESFGIDVERIVERVEQVHGENALAAAGRPRRRRWFGSDHIPFADEAKRALELTLSEALELGHKHIGAEHLLLALTTMPGPVADILRAHGVDHAAVRQVLARMPAG